MIINNNFGSGGGMKIKSIQQCSITMNDSSISAEVTINEVNVDKTILLYLGKKGTSGNYNSQTDCTVSLIDKNTVRAERTAAKVNNVSCTCTANVMVVEFE